MLNIKNEDMHIKVLCSICIVILVIIAILGKNFFDYIYIGLIFTFIFKNIIERFRK